MTPIIILAAVAAAPLLLALFLRVNAIFLFLSVAAGSLLLTSLGDDAILASRVFVRTAQLPMIVQLVVLLLPTVLTLLLMRKTMPKSKVLLHILPVLATSVALAVMVLPILPGDVQQQIFDSQYGETLRDAQDLVIGVAALLTLFLVWFTMRHKEDKDKKHKKH